MNNLAERTIRIRKFNPGIFQSDEEVIRHFVVRKRELDLSLDILRDNASSMSCQHVLFVAPRGRGKTMLLARIAAEIRTNNDLSDRLLPVRFMEESQEVFNMGDFWLETLFYLAQDGVQDPDIASEVREVRDALMAEYRGSELEQLARVAVLQIADRLEKKIVLMVENLQTLCQQVDIDFGWKLRQVLQTEPQIILLATATSRFAELDDVEHAFFELFRILRLDPLETDECKTLWQLVTGSEAEATVIRPLQILTGGDPRLLVIIGEFARHHSLRRLMEDLVSLIDDHTEYFRAHLEGIGNVERRVYLAMIDLWRPSTTGEISARARLDARTVSTMLGRLVHRGAAIVEGNGKKRTYVTAQRLYSIYYKLRRQRDEAAVVRNLIHFIVVFYSNEELPEMVGRLNSEAAQSPAIRDGIQQAIAEDPHIGHYFFHDEWQPVGQSSITDDKATKTDTKTIDQDLSSVDQKSPINIDQDIVLALWNKAATHMQLREYESGIATYDSLISAIGDSDVSELQIWVARAMINKGIAQGRHGDFLAVISTCDTVINRYGNSDVVEIRACVAEAMVTKGVAHDKLGNVQMALNTYDIVAGKFAISDSPKLQEWVAIALTNKGGIQQRLDDDLAAIATCDAIVNRFGDSVEPELQNWIATALVNMGTMQDQLGDTQSAMKNYDEVVCRFGKSDVLELQVWVAIALVNKGATQGQYGNTKAAIRTCNDVVRRYGDSGVPELQDWVARALINKGVAHKRTGDIQAAMDSFDSVVDRFENSDISSLQVCIAIALIEKGALQVRLNDYQDAIATVDVVINRFSDSDVPDLKLWTARALNLKGAVKGVLNEPQDAIDTFNVVVGRFGESDVIGIQMCVADALTNKGIAQDQMSDHEAAVATFDTVADRFGDSKVAELQVWVARALSRKGVVQNRIGDDQVALDTYGTVIERFGDSAYSEIQAEAIQSLINKAETEIRLGQAEAALLSCENFDRIWAKIVETEKDGVLEQRLKWIQTKALVLLGQHAEAMNLFRTVYAMFVPEQENMVEEVLELSLHLVAAGASVRDMIEILTSDSEKADRLLPLVVALRQCAGEEVREPVEVMEIAQDIRKAITEELLQGADSMNDSG